MTDPLLCPSEPYKIGGEMEYLGAVLLVVAVSMLARYGWSRYREAKRHREMMARSLMLPWWVRRNRRD